MKENSSGVALRDTCPVPPTTVYAGEKYGVATAEHEGAEWKYLSNADGTWGIPLVVRSIPGSEEFDAVTPYGYGGIHIDESLSDSQVLQLWQDSVSVLQSARIVSVFFRFPPFSPGQVSRIQSLPMLSVERVSSTILVDLEGTEDLLATFSSSCRKQVRRGLREGLAATITPANPDELRTFERLYVSSMDRLQARSEYYFNSSYFESLAELGQRARIVQVCDGSGRPVASSLVLLDEGVVHQHLSGADIGVRGANNVRVWALLDWAQKNGFLKAHLGGGTREGDSLFAFKQSFGGAAVDFHVGRLVVDEVTYDRLVAERHRRSNTDQTSQDHPHFFPAYRRPE